MFGIFKHPDPEEVLTRKQLSKLQHLYNAHKGALKARKRAWEKCLGIMFAQGNTKQTAGLMEARANFNFLRGVELDLCFEYSIELTAHDLKTKTQYKLEERLGKNKYGKTKKRPRQD